MTYIIRIKRQKERNAPSYWQEFNYENENDISIAALLHEFNERMPLKTVSGDTAEPIAWEYGCMQKKCGGCAMRINGIPRLACSTFLNTLKTKQQTIILEPLSKFSVIKDLMVDRTIIFESMKKMNIWLESDAHESKSTHELQFQSAHCLMCGCCLEICPNFTMDNNFMGTIAPVNAYRILDKDWNRDHLKVMSNIYQKDYFEGCGKSLACHNICPAGIPVEELIVNTNAAAVWKK